MAPSSWQLKTPIDAILFDCDGTLSQIEGVNELAKKNGVSDTIEVLTDEAMSVSGLTRELYQKRLALIQPTKNQTGDLADLYFENSVPDANEVIQLLQRINKSVYLISAGINPAVAIFGERLGVPRERIYAVDVTFDPHGNYIGFDQTSPLIHNHGKRDIVNFLKEKHTHLLHIGDGLNDYATHDIVTRFIGFGGVYYRENIASMCQYYIYALSLAALLPLCLTEQEFSSLGHHEKTLYFKGLDAIKNHQVKI